MKKVAILGFGGRGSVYATLCKKLKNDFEIVSVIDISKDKLGFAKSFLNLDDKALFDNFDDFIAMPKIADWLFVCTQDKQHLDIPFPLSKKAIISCSKNLSHARQKIVSLSNSVQNNTMFALPYAMC